MQTCNMVQAGYGEADITPDNPSEMVGFYRPDNRSRASCFGKCHQKQWQYGDTAGV